MTRRAGAFTLFALVLAACGKDSPVSPPPAVCPSAALAPTPAAAVPLEPLFAAAAAEFGVPESLLKAVGWAETRWQMVAGEAAEGRPVAYGVMGLRGEALARGAALAGVGVEAARGDAAANIRAAAALLRAYAQETGVSTPDLATWAPAVARYSGIELPAARDYYVRQAVYGALRSGVSTPVATLRAVTAPLPGPLAQASADSATTDFAGAVWRPSPNFKARPAGERVVMVIIHTCEGNYAGCWGWLASTESGVSAHYVVNEDGSEVTQLVREAEEAWHIGAHYDCSRDAEFDCSRNGQRSNEFTVGIEHAGFAAQSSWDAGEIDTSARLVCDITRRQGIPRDGVRIVAHGWLQTENRTDPGVHWPWADFLERIDHYCGDLPASAGLRVDDAAAVNDAARAQVAVPTGWTQEYLPTAFGGGQHIALQDAAPVVYSFYLPTAGARTLDGWWSPAIGRSAHTPFRVVDAQGHELGHGDVDQKSAGGHWRRLGSWNFPAGWSRLELSPPADACQAAADAIEVRG